MVEAIIYYVRPLTQQLMQLQWLSRTKVAKKRSLWSNCLPFYICLDTFSKIPRKHWYFFIMVEGLPYFLSKERDSSDEAWELACAPMPHHWSSSIESTLSVWFFLLYCFMCYKILTLMVWIMFYFMLQYLMWKINSLTILTGHVMYSVIAFIINLKRNTWTVAQVAISIF